MGAWGPGGGCCAQMYIYIKRGERGEGEGMRARPVLLLLLVVLLMMVRVSSSAHRWEM